MSTKICEWLGVQRNDFLKEKYMEVEWWMPCFVELANCFSILTLWLLGTSNKMVGGCD